MRIGVVLAASVVACSSVTAGVAAQDAAAPEHKMKLTAVPFRG